MTRDEKIIRNKVGVLELGDCQQFRVKAGFIRPA